MLEIRPTCEHCNKALPFDSKEAVICTFECTYCASCAAGLFKNVCPNCGGDFTQRPKRPEHLLDKYPVSKTVIYNPKDVGAHLKKYNL
ncbi:DUF1272 domain-containing protein [uncultured Lacinutrix sp.]|uniref:DUF1272 domain-containing protein n=1 Tax=uncultured Lacinutrix sp. TaxID=574032 RepID=UPI00262E23ED|nr:DUF1272 domain-containing protein [uncultured Lacinutrix sp.]